MAVKEHTVESLVSLKQQLERSIFMLIDGFQSNPICEGVRVASVSVSNADVTSMQSQMTSYRTCGVHVELRIP